VITSCEPSEAWIVWLGTDATHVALCCAGFDEVWLSGWNDTLVPHWELSVSCYACREEVWLGIWNKQSGAGIESLGTVAKRVEFSFDTLSKFFSSIALALLPM